MVKSREKRKRTENDISSSGEERGVLLGRPATGKPQGIWRWLRSERLPMERRQERGHLLTLAPSRSGVRAGLFLPNLLSYQAGAIAFDERGDLFWASAPWRSGIGPESLGQTVEIFDPFGLADPRERTSRCQGTREGKEGDVLKRAEERKVFYDKRGGYINPLVGLWGHGEKRAVSAARRLAHAFVATLEEQNKEENDEEKRLSKQSILGGRDLLEFLFLHAAVGKEFGRSCASIPALSKQLQEREESVRESFLVRASEDERLPALLRRTAKDLSEREDDYLEKAARAATEALRPFQKGEAAEALGKGRNENERRRIDFDRYFSDLGRKGGADRSLYVVLGNCFVFEQKSNLLGRIVEGELVAAALRSVCDLSESAPPAEAQTLWLLPEESRYRGESDFARLVRPENERSGCRVWARYKDVHNITYVHGEREGQALLESVRVLQSTYTIDYSTTVEIARRARQQGPSSKESPEAIRRMEEGQLLLFEGGKEGRDLESVPCWKEKLFARRLTSR